jgi:phage shock protein PspC (stress-responsive transcriptional regulator)
MASNEFLDSVQKNLNGRPGQPLLLGVCGVLAKKLGTEPWVTRLGAIILVFFFQTLVPVAYVVLGLAMDETAERTRGIFKGLFIAIREGVEKLLNALGNLFNDKQRNGG